MCRGLRRRFRRLGAVGGGCGGTGAGHHAATPIICCHSVSCCRPHGPHGSSGKQNDCQGLQSLKNCTWQLWRSEEAQCGLGVRHRM